MQQQQQSKATAAATAPRNYQKLQSQTLLKLSAVTCAAFEQQFGFRIRSKFNMLSMRISYTVVPGQPSAPRFYAKHWRWLHAFYAGYCAAVQQLPRAHVQDYIETD